MKLRNSILLIVISILFFSASAQKKKSKISPDNWYHLDPKQDKVMGVSSKQAYNYLKGKTSKTVVVAIIDGGSDINHEDLKDNIWTNPGEIAGNGKDDDKNGFIDDIHGWDFIGGKDGTPVGHDTYELTRLYARQIRAWDDADTSKMTREERKAYDKFLLMKEDYLSREKEARTYYEYFAGIERGVNSILTKLKTESPTDEELQNIPPINKDEIIAKGFLVKFLKRKISVDDLRKNLVETKEHYRKEVEYHLNLTFNPRTIVGDSYETPNQRNYGNNEVVGPEADHGTHVAGIVGAMNGNNIGMDGIAINVKLMILRVVPDGDERDKDVANAIRYAAENGATIINMSFGKQYVYNKKAVDEAIKFAMSKDVLMIHAAGNDGQNNDEIWHYPVPFLDPDSIHAVGWIEVVATDWQKGKHVVAEFSNYGKKSCDVMAPGVNIYSTTPKNKYAKFSGTSMASPVTAGVAAIIRSYFPSLSAEQVKAILINSVTKVKGKVYVPGIGKKKKAKEICIAGGVINAYNAVLLAEKTTPKKK